MSAAQRAKGKRGQAAFAAVLASRDWMVRETNSGKATEDFIAIDADGKAWSVEVKNTKAITTEHRAQAMRQAKAARLPWLLASKIEGTSCWLVQRQGFEPMVWKEKSIAA